MQGALWASSRRLGPCPRQGDSHAAHVAPKRHLGIWHKKDSSPQGHPLATTPHPTPVQQGPLSPSLEIRNPALFPEDRSHRKEATQGGEPRNRSTKTHRPGKQTHTHTHRPPCTHGYTHTQTTVHARLHRHTGPPQCQRLGRTDLGSGSSSSMPWPFSIWQQKG